MDKCYSGRRIYLALTTADTKTLNVGFNHANEIVVSFACCARGFATGMIIVLSTTISSQKLICIAVKETSDLFIAVFLLCIVCYRDETCVVYVCVNPSALLFKKYPCNIPSGNFCAPVIAPSCEQNGLPSLS